jgi:DNA-directed RNA polymerase subunit M/transcription elongation factor TFIIS
MNKDERRMDMAEKKFKEICTCDHCGSEAEMVITCSLEPVVDNAEPSATTDDKIPQTVAGKTKGRGVCSHCGNESEIWVEI